MAEAAVKPRRSWSHKGENGVVLVVGGSWLYHGAPFLSAMAALRAGADLAYIAVPERIAPAVRALSPNVIVIPLSDLKLTRGAARRVMKVLPEVDVVVVGPGLAQGSEKGIGYLLQEAGALGKGMVLDATALFPEILPRVRERRAVLTPHAGEFKRLFGIGLREDVEERAKWVKEKAGEHRVTILLKGHIDVISDGERVAINRTGSPAMTAGGTGDVLTGIIASLMAKGASSFEAAAAAAWINGKAGELAASRLGLHLVATDIIDVLPEVMKRFDRINP